MAAGPASIMRAGKFSGTHGRALRVAVVGNLLVQACQDEPDSLRRYFEIVVVRCS